MKPYALSILAVATLSGCDDSDIQSPEVTLALASNIMAVGESVEMDGSDTSNNCLWEIESSPEGSNPVITELDNCYAEFTSDKIGEYTVSLNGKENNLEASVSKKITVGTLLSTNFTEDAKLDKSGSPYIIKGEGPQVANGVTVTVDNGVVIIGDGTDGHEPIWTNNGIVVTNGTEEEPVTIENVHFSGTNRTTTAIILNHTKYSGNIAHMSYYPVEVYDSELKALLGTFAFGNNSKVYRSKITVEYGDSEYDRVVLSYDNIDFQYNTVVSDSFIIGTGVNTIKYNDFSRVSQVIAIERTDTIDITQNYWGLIDSTLISDKLRNNNTDGPVPAPYLYDFEPFLSEKDPNSPE